MQDPLPPVNKTYASIIQEERQRSITTIPNTAAETGKTTPGPSGSTIDEFAGNASFNQPRVTCHHCGMPGHIVAKCYKLHGYPPGHKFYGKNSNKSRNNQLGKPCGNFSGLQERQSSGEVGQSGQCNVPDQDLIQSITNQYQQLMNLLSQKSQEPPKTSPNPNQPMVSQFSGKNFPILHNRWIIDTGATHHDNMKTRTIGMGDRNGDLYYLNLSHNSIPPAMFFAISDFEIVDNTESPVFEGFGCKPDVAENSFKACSIYNTLFFSPLQNNRTSSAKAR
uniref:CCHC-type domain-containing protein n=1 Tax=Cannabis sativa TaxID=3483 RepID=A0A803PE73_CANSA